jgi:hypothetical protein
MARPEYCPCEDDSVDPCPACGATVKGDDKVHGMCQAKHQRAPSSWVPQIILVDKKTGKPI